MEAMRAVVLVTCVISILSGVLDALKPNARFDRQLRLLLHDAYVTGGALDAMLRQHGIADAQAEAEMYISGDNCIEIEQVTVYCTDPAAAEPLLTDCLGKEVKIHVETAS